MIKIYHVPGTRSLRPIWLCYELDLAFEIDTIDFSPEARKSTEWRAISPTGKVPALTDGDLTMFESGAMIDYILERYGDGRLRPAPGTAESAVHQQWCWFSESTLIRPLGINLLLRKKEESGNAIAAEGEQKTRECLEVVDQAVSDRDFLLGADFTAADIMMGFTLQLLAKLKLLDAQYPHAQSYLDRLMARDAFKRTMNS